MFVEAEKSISAAGDSLPSSKDVRDKRTGIQTAARESSGLHSIPQPDGTGLNTTNSAASNLPSFLSDQNNDSDDHYHVLEAKDPTPKNGIDKDLTVESRVSSQSNLFQEEECDKQACAEEQDTYYMLEKIRKHSKRLTTVARFGNQSKSVVANIKIVCMLTTCILLWSLRINIFFA